MDIKIRAHNGTPACLKNLVAIQLVGYAIPTMIISLHYTHLQSEKKYNPSQITMAVLTHLNLDQQSLLLVLAILLWIVPLYVLRRFRAFKRTPLPPSPMGIPILGNLLQLGSLPHRSLRALADKHGRLMLLRLGQVPTLIISSADVAGEMMIQHELIFSSRPQSKVARTVFYGGSDLVFAPYGEFWKKAKKVCVTHLLSTKMVYSFRHIREVEVSIMIDKISSQASSVIDMTEVLIAFVNDYFCRAISGRLSGNHGRKKLIRELTEEVSDLLGSFVVGEYIPYLGWVDGLLGLNERAKRTSKRWDDVLDKVIKDSVNQRRGDGVEDDNDFVNILLSLQKDPDMDFHLTNAKIKALLVDMLAAGMDPTHIVLEWAMAELVRHPQVMKKLHYDVRGKSRGEGMIREEDLWRMTYLKAVVKEVLRLHPPAPLLIPRELTEDCQIHGYKVLKKSRVIVNAWAISRDSKHWEAPEEFRPERFLGSAVDFKGNDFQFIPFGAGLRICPGMNFSMTIIELALANLINQFEWELPYGVTTENMDMSEAPGIVSRKNQKLELVAKQRKVTPAKKNMNLWGGSF